MVTKERNIIAPRFRVYGEIVEFETERHLEWFFWDAVLAKIGLKPLKRQHICREGVCDILAQGIENQLVIIELKNTQDSHVIKQITSYFHALKEEQPFAEQIDYTKPIDLCTVCPSYSDRTELVLEYHKLDFTLLSYRTKRNNNGFVFTLYKWIEKTELTTIEIPLSFEDYPRFSLPDPPKSFVDLLEKSSEYEKRWVIQIRDQIYRFAQDLNYKISEKSEGKWTRFERNKQNPITEIGWDNKRDGLAIYLWLPFATINGKWNMRGTRGDNYRRTSMMRIWVVDGIVKYIGYIENGRKSWLIVTSDELKDAKFTQPTKLNKWMKYGDNRYWKGLAMPTQFYLQVMTLTDRSNTLNAFVELALQHSLQRIKKSRQKDSIETISDL
jgi:Endonuclease NucS